MRKNRLHLVGWYQEHVGHGRPRNITKVDAALTILHRLAHFSFQQDAGYHRFPRHIFDLDLVPVGTVSRIFHRICHAKADPTLLYDSQCHLEFNV